MSLIGWIKGLRAVKDAGTGLTKSIGDVVHRAKERKHGNVEKDNERSFELDKASMDQFAKEFRDNKNWFDSFIDGINRIPRPMMAFSVLAVYLAYNSSPFILLAIGQIDYAQFLTLIQSMFLDQYELIITVFAFYFTGRFLEKRQKQKNIIDFARFAKKESPTDDKKEDSVGYDFDALIDKHFSAKSKERLLTCHRDLQKICAVACSRMDFSVLEGKRSLEDQQKYFAEGKSKLDGIKKKSKHQSNPSMAVDIAPYPIDWNDTARFIKLSEVMFSVAAELKEQGEVSHRLRWGGDFNQDGDYTNDNFVDMPHWELK